MKGSAVAAAVLLAWFCLPSPAGAQSQKVYRVGRLLGAAPAFGRGYFSFPGLREFGYVEGQNVRFEGRYEVPGVDEGQLRALAEELVGLKVDVIVASGTAVIRAVTKATRTIPVVMVSHVDPVRAGFVASLSRPGGNVTGISTLSPYLAGKRLELLRDAVPGLRRVAVLWNPSVVGREAEWKELEDAARLMRLELQSVEVRRREDVEGAIQAAARQHAGALLVLSDPLTWGQYALISELAVKHRLPTMVDNRYWLTEKAGLMVYGPLSIDISWRVAALVDRILKGAKPADLPIEQPTRFELVVNQRAARAIGLQLPQAILLRADSVLE